MMDLLLIISGLVFLFFGGDGLTQGSVTLAKKMNLSTLLISTVVIGFGTSVPELLISVNASLQDAPSIALGNIIGSNICNTLLIIGFGAVLATIPCDSLQVKKSLFAVMGASLFLALLSFTGEINRFIGLAMMMLLAAYLSYSIKTERKKVQEELLEEFPPQKEATWKTITKIIISICLLLAGAHFLVESSVSIARNFGVSEAVIGLTLVALGTSLPELATVYAAARHKNTDMIIGNALGSNLFNILGILGITAFIKPLSFTGQLAEQDVWIMLATAGLITSISLNRKQINRTMGIILLVLYFSYILWISPLNT